jgi:hypothetical protein
LFSTLEVDAPAELQRAGIAEGGDIAESAASYSIVDLRTIVARRIVLRMVQKIERLDANLELAFAPDMEAAEDTRVDGVDSRATELIAVRVAEVGSNNGGGRRYFPNWLRLGNNL